MVYIEERGGGGGRFSPEGEALDRDSIYKYDMHEYAQIRFVVFESRTKAIFQKLLSSSILIFLLIVAHYNYQKKGNVFKQRQNINVGTTDMAHFSEESSIQMFSKTVLMWKVYSLS